MKNFLSHWFKRTSNESSSGEYPDGLSMPPSRMNFAPKDGLDMELPHQASNGEALHESSEMVQEPGASYQPNATVEGEGDFPRKKMDENLYRALSG